MQVNKIDERRQNKKNRGRSREAKMRSKWEEEWRDEGMETGEVSCAPLWMTVTIIQFSVMGAQTGPRANQITESCSGDRTSRSLWPYLYAQPVCNQGNRICGQQMPCQTHLPTYKSFLTDKWCHEATICSLVRGTAAFRNTPFVFFVWTKESGQEIVKTSERGPNSNSDACMSTKAQLYKAHALTSKPWLRQQSLYLIRSCWVCVTACVIVWLQLWHALHLFGVYIPLWSKNLRETT